MNTGEFVEYLILCLTEAQEMSDSIGVKNLFYNERYVELIMAHLLGHTYNSNIRGHDAFDHNGDPVEYKSINLVSTNKGSFQFHWLSENKLNSYNEVKDVYFALRNDIIIEEIWKLSMDVIFKDLQKKFLKGEQQRFFLNDIGVHKLKNIDAHKSYSLNKIQYLGAELVYTRAKHTKEANANQ